MKSERTKQLIITEALRLFASNGYDATTMEQIARAANMKTPSLYNHFPGKQAIFEAVVDYCKEECARLVENSHLYLKHGSAEQRILSMTVEDQINDVKRLFRFTLHSEFPSLFHRLLVVEQYRHTRLAVEYNRYIVEKQLQIFTDLARIMIANGRIVSGDPEAIALQYVSPISLLLELCFRQPEKEQLALELLEEHIRQFNRVYVVKPS